LPYYQIVYNVEPLQEHPTTTATVFIPYVPTSSSNKNIKCPKNMIQK